MGAGKTRCMETSRRSFLGGLLALPLSAGPAADAYKPWTTRLIEAARDQVGVTRYYDPAYVRLDYPMGDVPRDRGVCIDVVIRAYRDAFDFDFQKAVHEDMAANFAVYPRNWGLSRTDRNIDHRRVPNIETWLKRRGHQRPARDWRPGDLLTCRVPRNLPHIAIVSDRRGADGQYKVIHNIGRGTREETLIGVYGEERRFQFDPL